MLQAKEDQVSTEQVTDSFFAQPATNPQFSRDAQTGGTIKKLLKWSSTVNTCTMYKKIEYYIYSA